MSEQTLKFGENVINKKAFYTSKQAIALNSVNTNNIVVSDKFKLNDDGFFFIKIVTHTMKTNKSKIKNNYKYNGLNIYLNHAFRINAARTINYKLKISMCYLLAP